MDRVADPFGSRPRTPCPGPALEDMRPALTDSTTRRSVDANFVPFRDLYVTLLVLRRAFLQGRSQPMQSAICTIGMPDIAAAPAHTAKISWVGGMKIGYWSVTFTT